MSAQEDVFFMRRAIRLAHQRSLAKAGGPFGAVIVCRGAVVGRGWNKVTSTNDPTAHAEMVAIRAASRKLRTFNLKGCSLYTSCEPCPMCPAATYWARLDRIIYGASRADAADIGFDDAFLYRQLSLSPSRRKLLARQLLPEEAAAVMQGWLRMPGRVPY